MTGAPTYAGSNSYTNQVGHALALQANAPALLDVVFAGGVGIAVGGFVDNVAGSTTPFSNQHNPSYGVILVSTNGARAADRAASRARPLCGSPHCDTRARPLLASGGTVWSNVAIQPYTTDTFGTATAPTAAMSAALAQTSPGVLLGVGAAASGRYVYAVGAAPVTGACCESRPQVEWGGRPDT